MLRIATVTEKSTGHRYEVYRVPGDHGLRLQAELDEQRRTAPLYRQAFSMTR